jgi:hypothetical protein
VAAAAVVVLVASGCGSGVREVGGATTTTDGADAGGPLVGPPTSGEVTVPPGEDPTGVLGDDPELNDLAQACFEGDLFACDTLFARTEVGSELEAYSVSCGGRVRPDGGAPGCARRFDASLPAAQTPGALGDDPAGDALAEACFRGDFGACDDLFLQSPVDSAYEAYGSTCGGRLAIGSAGGCETQLAEP